ncbi:MAG: hypothetical protein EOM17_13845 [Synergistales bacterium]|nr:hypothetical protein [Synergistales bacterium]
MQSHVQAMMPSMDGYARRKQMLNDSVARMARHQGWQAPAFSGGTVPGVQSGTGFFENVAPKLPGDNYASLPDPGWNFWKPKGGTPTVESNRNPGFTPNTNPLLNMQQESERRRREAIERSWQDPRIVLDRLDKGPEGLFDIYQERQRRWDKRHEGGPNDMRIMLDRMDQGPRGLADIIPEMQRRREEAHRNGPNSPYIMTDAIKQGK